MMSKRNGRFLQTFVAFWENPNSINIWFKKTDNPQYCITTVDCHSFFLNQTLDTYLVSTKLQAFLKIVMPSRNMWTLKSDVSFQNPNFWNTSHSTEQICSNAYLTQPKILKSGKIQMAKLVNSHLVKSDWRI